MPKIARIQEIPGFGGSGRKVPIWALFLTFGRIPRIARKVKKTPKKRVFPSPGTPGIFLRIDLNSVFSLDLGEK